MGLLVDCEHCRSSFEVDPKLAGGMTNCERCGKATQVAGLRDPLWRLLQAGGVLASLGAGYACYTLGSPLLGLAVGLGVLALLWLLSRAF